MQRVSAAGRLLAAAARPWLGELAAAGAGMMLAFLIIGRHRILSSLRGLRTGGGGADSDEEAEILRCMEKARAAAQTKKAPSPEMPTTSTNAFAKLMTKKSAAAPVAATAADAAGIHR